MLFWSSLQGFWGDVGVCVGGVGVLWRGSWCLAPLCSAPWKNLKNFGLKYLEMAQVKLHSC